MATVASWRRGRRPQELLPGPSTRLRSSIWILGQLGRSHEDLLIIYIYISEEYDVMMQHIYIYIVFLVRIYVCYYVYFAL